MKRPWSVEDHDGSSSDESSNSESDEESTAKTKGKAQPNKGSDSKAKSVKRRSGAVDFEALMQRGYRGGPSVLKVPAPKEADGDRDWTWSTGKEKRSGEGERGREESYEERQKTRAALADGEELAGKQTRREWRDKEKRKRELGQASRGKNYVEEEKRLLRDSGVYSGFDT